VTYFDLSNLKFSSSNCTESTRILNAMVTTVWFLYPLRKCDVLGMFSAKGTKVEIRKLEKKLGTMVSVDTLKSPGTKYRRDKVALKTTARAYARGLGLPPLEHDILQNFITCAKEINKKKVITKNGITSKNVFRLTRNFSYIRSSL